MPQSPARAAPLGPATEQDLTDLARRQLSIGNDRDALATLQRLAKEVPHGLKHEDRETLLIEALAGMDRTAEAQQRARAFRARYPNSFLLPRVNAALKKP